MQIKCFNLIRFKVLTRDIQFQRSRKIRYVVIYIRKQLTYFTILALTSALITYYRLVRIIVSALENPECNLSPLNHKAINLIKISVKKIS